MEERVRVTLDFTQCKYLGECFKEMRTKMEWDDDFGQNLSALWDILWGMPYKGDDFTIFRLRQYTDIPHGQDSAFTEYVDKICAIFQRAQDQGLITVDIQYHSNSNSSFSDYLV